jgi:hypothetical protein
MIGLEYQDIRTGAVSANNRTNPFHLPDKPLHAAIGIRHPQSRITYFKDQPDQKPVRPLNRPDPPTGPIFKPIWNPLRNSDPLQSYHR